MSMTVLKKNDKRRREEAVPVIMTVIMTVFVCIHNNVMNEEVNVYI